MPPLSAPPGTEPTDAELCRALAEQGARALGPIYDRHASLVYGLARAMLRDTDEAEDLVQDVFLAFQRRGRFDPARGTLAAYLGTMTRSMALDRLRARKRRAVANDTLQREAPADVDPVTPLDVLVEGDEGRRVREALDRLPPKSRQVLELAYYRGMSQTEIATVLGSPLGTVKTWARTGLLALRRTLEGPKGANG